MPIIVLDLQDYVRNVVPTIGCSSAEGLLCMLEELNATGLVLVKEGVSKRRREIYPEYRSVSKLKEDDPLFKEKYEALMGSKSNIDDLLLIVEKGLESIVVQHPDHEAKDVIAALVGELAEKRERITVVSTNPAYAQLLAKRLSCVSVYDAKKREHLRFAKCTVEQEVVHEALLGSAIDNVPPVDGYFAASDARALATKAHQDLEAFLVECSSFKVLNESQIDQLKRNIEIVRFSHLDEEARKKIACFRGKWDPAAILIDMQMLGSSLGNDFPRLSTIVGRLKRVEL